MKLKDYLEKTGISNFDFALKCGISPTKVHKLLTDKPGDILLGTAMRIKEGSGGNVDYEDLITEKTTKRRLRRVKNPLARTPGGKQEKTHEHKKEGKPKAIKKYI